MRVYKEKSKRNFYRLSLLLNIFNITQMCLKLYTGEYELFLTLLGATVVLGSSVPLVIRWNWSCGTKFVDMFNEFIMFETYLNVHGFSKSPKRKSYESINCSQVPS